MDDRRITPRRPALTPVFTCSIAFWLTCALAYAASADAKADTCLLAAVVCIIVSVGVGAVGALSKRRKSCIVIAVAIAGCSISLGYSAYVHTLSDKILEEGINDLVVTVLDDSKDYGTMNQALCRVTLPDGRGVNVIAKLPADTAVFCGQTLSITGNAIQLLNASKQYAWQKGAIISVKAREAELRTGFYPVELLVSIRRKAIQSLGSQDDAHMLLQALCCGYRENLEKSEAYPAFQTCGLAHMVAVSGAHLVIVTGLLSIVLKSLHIARRLSVVLLVSFIIVYTVLAGMPYSCVRAAVMSSAGILSIFGRRRPSSSNALGVSIICLLIVSPYASLTPSFALSALSTAGIVVFCPLVQYVLERALRHRLMMLVSPLSLTLAAGMLAQMYSCSLFCQLPLIAPIANLICTPLLPLSCALGLAAGCAAVVNLPFAAILVASGSMMTSLMNLVVQHLSHIPFACIPVSIDAIAALAISFSFACAVWLNWKRFLDPTTWLAAFVCMAAVFIGLGFTPSHDCIAMLDVGQGDSFLLKSEGKTLLIDTGNKDSLLLDQLGRYRMAHIDAVLITHADDDHCGSLDALERSVDVSEVFVASDMLVCTDENCKEVVEQAGETAGMVTGLRFGDVIDVGNFKATVIWPESFCDSGGNADSIVLYVQHIDEITAEVDFTALFTGDAEKEELDKALKRYEIGNIDILKVGHHGSKDVITLGQARILLPRIALIGVGEGNRYGHPAQETLDIFDKVGSKVFRTDIDGGMRFDIIGGRIIAHKT